ncbi:MAG: hypothetical protein QNJ47_14165, partial [Nostocaceae cyanobacterium]|nr:hypothetical protein [Nostocaceae cyanobacterium]
PKFGGTETDTLRVRHFGGTETDTAKWTHRQLLSAYAGYKIYPAGIFQIADAAKKSGSALSRTT